MRHDTWMANAQHGSRVVEDDTPVCACGWLQRPGQHTHWLPEEVSGEVELLPQNAKLEVIEIHFVLRSEAEEREILERRSGERKVREREFVSLFVGLQSVRARIRSIVCKASRSVCLWEG